MDLTYSLISALAIGFLGSLHCVGMCGGISGALATAIKPVSHRSALADVSRRLAYQFMYSSGRLFSYSVAGGIAGFLGDYISSTMPHGVSYVRTFAGVMLIFLGLYISGWWMVLARLERAGTVLWKRIAPLTRHLMPVDSYRKALALGALWGWLPCGLVYSALAWSVGSGNAVDGALLMLYFGIGTLPAMIGVGLFANMLSDIARSKAMRSLAGLLLILYGVWTIWGHIQPMHH
ncbi:MAG: sulfite exporter TauE/SafE family protein [Ketobacteraceae bacterium]|nr:sulfite exporter TauE/SafE family protein [Ketobacteraceae bacterium]